MKIWIVSDTHFNHDKLMEYEHRPQGFNELIVRNWNKVVDASDLVIHLGDVILGRNSELPQFLNRLNGKKILTRGNHDHESMEWYMQRGFDFVCDYYIYKEIAFSHAPLTPLPLQTNRQKTGTEEWESREVKLNIHGHFHRGTHRGQPGMPDRYYDHVYFHANRNKYQLIQIEDTFRPILLDTIIKGNKL